MVTTSATAPGHLGIRAWLTLLTLCGATFAVGLDYSIITVALPEIGRDLGFSGPGSLQWVATACLLPTASLLPLFARLSDVVGRRRLFAIGVALFTALSFAAGVAVSPGTLIAARAGQGVAAAMIGPTAMAHWLWTMMLLVAMGAAVLAGALLLLLPRDAERTATTVDVPGAVLSGAGLFALVYGISTGGDTGWTAPSTVGSLAAAVLLLTAFTAVEARRRDPLVPLRLLRRRAVAAGSLVGLITFGMCGGATLLLSIHMQDVLGYSPLATGFGFLAEGGAVLSGAGRSPRVSSARTGPRGRSRSASSCGAPARGRWRSCRMAGAPRCCSSRPVPWASGMCSRPSRSSRR